MRHSQHKAFIRPLAALIFAIGPVTASAQLQSIQTRYYTIHSDLDRDTIREATLRVTRMVEVYMDRTKGFSGRVTTRLPFYLFRNPEDYMAAGGIPGSAGVYTGTKLMAIAGDRVTSGTWSLVQHEGFHQFVDMAMGGDIPVWVNEGLAEYFGEGIFTGDGMITGLIPPDRARRIKAMIESDDHKSVVDMMLLGRRDWNHAMKASNYDQAWSMVHFLAHGDGQEYQEEFDGFMQDVSKRRMDWQKAWRKNFGTDTDGFENAWRNYWQALPENPSRNSYVEATTATLTSFLARAVSQKQKFQNYDAFRQVAEEGALTAHKDDWLPPSLLKHALHNARNLGSWTLPNKRGKNNALICKLEDGTKLVGTFKVKNRRVQSVKVKLTPP